MQRPASSPRGKAWRVLGVVLPAETWAAMRHDQVELLLVAEGQGLAGAIAWLEARGLDWIGRPEPPARK
jgi:hypothetical protein